MKNTLLVIAVLLVGGCAGWEPVTLGVEEYRQRQKDVVGTYVCREVHIWGLVHTDKPMQIVLMADGNAHKGPLPPDDLDAFPKEYVEMWRKRNPPTKSKWKLGGWVEWKRQDHREIHLRKSGGNIHDFVFVHEEIFRLLADNSLVQTAWLDGKSRKIKGFPDRGKDIYKKIK